MNQDILVAAEQLIDRGFYLFPVGKDKNPMTTHGWKDATDDIVVIKDMIQRRERQDSEPQLAIACGQSGLFVVDIDVKNGVDGFHSLRQLEEEYGTLPETVRAQSPSGGGHLYFKGRGKSTIGSLATAIDTRSEGGYIICPPSIREDGKAYRWVEGSSLGEIDIAEVPEWLITLSYETPEKPTAKPKQNPVDSEQRLIPAGERNDTLFCEACKLRDASVDYTAALAAITVMYLEKCEQEPPMDEKELANIVASAYKYPAKKRNVGRPKKDLVALAAQFEAFGIEDLNDTGNARRLVHNFGDVIRYCYGMKDWLVWDEMRWCIDNNGRIERFIKATAEQIRDEATCFEEGSDECKAILSHASKSLEQHKIRAAKENATSEATIGIERETLDVDPFLLNVANGTIDLRTGELLPHLKENFITQITNVAYNPEASCPEWTAFLRDIMGGNVDLVEYLQRVIGYALTGDISEQCVFIFYGTGSNGKSTFIETIHALLGDYSQGTKFSTFTEKGEHALAILAGFEKIRLVTASESKADAALAEDLIKEITGGEAITAKALYKMPFTYHPQFKLILSANHRPPIRHQDHGTWRRIRLIPFEVTIPKDKQRKDLPGILRDELPGILTWAVKGCLAWQSGRQGSGDGLNTPEIVINATEEYKDDMDTIADFLRDKFVIDSSYKVEQKVVYPLYQEWNQANGNRYSLSKRNLNEALIERCFTLKASNGKKWYTGLKPKMDVIRDWQDEFRDQYQSN